MCQGGTQEGGWQKKTERHRRNADENEKRWWEIMD
jgi:hypothetical protein